MTVWLGAQQDKGARVEGFTFTRAADLAIVRSSLSASGFTRLGAPRNVGESVAAYGFPLRLTAQHWDSVTGELEQLDHQHPDALWRDGVRLLKFKEAHIVGGFSGGPLLSTITGRVIGVVSTTRDARFDLGGVAVPVTVVLDEVDVVRQAQQTKNWRGTPWDDGPLLAHRIPDLPPHFLPQAVALAEVKSALLNDGQLQIGIRASRPAGIHGLGGIGKTVLGLALAHDPVVQRVFSDGVYWLTLGQQPDLLALQRQVVVWATGKSVDLESVNLGTVALREALGEKECLLVLDDVWQVAHAEAFAAIGPRSRLLVTTRDREILTAIGALTVNVDVLDPSAATRLLAEWADQTSGPLPKEAIEVAKECGYLPLALASAGAMARDGATWPDILEALRDGDLLYMDHADRSVFKCLGASVRALTAIDAELYCDLAIFPEDVGVPETVIVRMWTRRGERERDARKALNRFASKALLFIDSYEGGRTVRFHDLQGNFLRLVAQSVAASHLRLLDAYFGLLPEADGGAARWALLPADETYLWKYLLYHLLGAGQPDTVQALVTDVRWLAAKSAASGVSSLLTELATLVQQAPTRENQAVERALRLEAGWLYPCPEALEGLLYNRLRSEGWSAAEIRGRFRLHPAVRLNHQVDLGEGRVFRGHTGRASACTYSPDGSRVLSASWDTTVREWDRATGHELRSFKGHSGWVTACAYSPDGSRVLSASWDTTIREWDRATGHEVRSFKGHSSWVSACAYSPDGSHVLSASADTTVREWDRATAEEVQRFKGHVNVVTACVYSPDGSRILSASHDNTVREWDRATGHERRRFMGHAGGVTDCSYSPDGSRVLSASWDATVREWDRATGGVLRRFEGHRSRVEACAYSPDGSRVLSASCDKALREWDEMTGRELQRYEGHSSDVTSCAYSPDGSRILSTSSDTTVREWDGATGRELRPFAWHAGGVTALRYSRDGSYILSASSDTTVREWNRVTGREQWRVGGHSDRVNAVAYSPDGARILSGSHDATFREWDRATCRELCRFEGHSGPVDACAYSPDGSRVLSASHDATVREWDYATGRELQRFEGHSTWVSACAYSPDGLRVLSASHDATVREWDRATGRELRRFDGHSAPVESCAYSPDGSRVISASWDTTVREWDRTTGRERHRFEGHSDRVKECIYTPDGSRAVSASSDSTVRIWSFDQDRCLDAIRGAAAFFCLAATPGHLAAGDALGNVWILDCDWC